MWVFSINIIGVSVISPCLIGVGDIPNKGERARARIKAGITIEKEKA